MLDQVVAGWDLFDRIRSLFRRPPDTVVTRFVRVLESHGVQRNQIPRFFGHGLTLQDVQDDASLLSKLNERMLAAACSMFAVRREWLDGAETQVHSCHDFYKNPAGFLKFIASLKDSNENGRIDGVLLVADPTEKPKARLHALLILEDPIGSLGQKQINRYHICNNWSFNYWKSRAYLTACIAVAWKNDVHIRGLHAPSKTIEAMAEGKTLLGWEGQEIPGDKLWYPEDMALDPDVYLSGIDPEQNNFGTRSALGEWLNLEEKGWMNVGFGDSKRADFEAALTKI